MASEYLTRQPTTSGNRHVWTISCWVKTKDEAVFPIIQAVTGFGTGDHRTNILGYSDQISYQHTRIQQAVIQQAQYYRHFTDTASWYHLVFTRNDTLVGDTDRFRIYVNGVRQQINSTYNIPQSPTGNDRALINAPVLHKINEYSDADSVNARVYGKSYFSDYFLVDGQELTPDVFGYTDKGKGNVLDGTTIESYSSGGRWVPRSPRIIRTIINSKGGFGVNGFYLPMNDSSNAGADFHCTPNSIIKLKGEDEAQPKNGAPVTSDNFISQLREDPYKDHIVLAVPGVSGGLSNGFGDYSASIKGSGVNKVPTSTGHVGIGSNISHRHFYGSHLEFNDSSSGLQYDIPALGRGEYTIEFWSKRDRSLPSGSYTYDAFFGIGNVNTAGSLTYTIEAFNVWLREQQAGDTNYTNIIQNTSYPQDVWYPQGQWVHTAITRKKLPNGNCEITLYIDGSAVETAIDVTCREISATTINIGSLGSNGGYAFFGCIQDFRIYQNLVKYESGFEVSKPWQLVNFGSDEEWRISNDTTKNNFCTWDHLSAFGGAVTNGATTVTSNDCIATMGAKTGKWYWEAKLFDPNTSDGAVHHVGWTFANNNDDSGSGESYTGSYGRLVVRSDGTNQTTNGASMSVNNTDGSAPAYGDGDIGGFAIDLDSSPASARFYKNGNLDFIINFTYYGKTSAIPFNRANGLTNVSNFGQNPSFCGNETVTTTYTDANGRGKFKYQPPAGYLSLCSENLPTPIENPADHVLPVIYRGTDDTVKVKCGFQPDLVWIKNRDYVNWHSWADSIRGPFLELNSNSIEGNRDRSSNDGLRSFDYDGFTSGIDANTGGRDGDDYVAYCWKAGGKSNTFNVDGVGYSTAAAAGITDGNIPLTGLSTNTTAGFSILSYTGNGGNNQTIAHGLGKTPGLIIVKNLSSNASWGIWHQSYINEAGYFSDTPWLNNSFAAYAFNEPNASGTYPTSSVFYVSGSGRTYNSDMTNGNNHNFISYCWAEIEGFSRFGRYKGNGLADGPFIHCGFKPAIILIKPATTTEYWTQFDTARIPKNSNTDIVLYPGLSNGDSGDGISVHIFSNGFKIHNATTARYNEDNQFYIYAAWAEAPQKYANAR